jgi:hypothetical protein
MTNRYQNIAITQSLNGPRHYIESKYPEISFSNNDIYVITTVNDRFDVMAQTYYGDSSLWWIISLANDFLPQNSLYAPIGIQLRIPSNVNNVISNFSIINEF